MHKNGRLDDHQRFKELGALAQGGECSDSDWLELKHHLQTCGSCREAYREYSLIAKEGMPFLAAAYGYTPECKSWDEGAAWSELLSRTRGVKQPQPALELDARCRLGKLEQLSHQLARRSRTQGTVPATRQLVCEQPGRSEPVGERGRLERRELSEHVVVLQHAALQRRGMDLVEAEMGAEALARLGELPAQRRRAQVLDLMRLGVEPPELERRDRGGIRGEPLRGPMPG